MGKEKRIIVETQAVSRVRTCCLLGAGFSRVAGLPLTHELFERFPASLSRSSSTRFENVLAHYQVWRSEHPEQNTEEYLADRYGQIFDAAHVPFAWVSEFLAAVLATPRYSDVSRINPRYGIRVSSPPYNEAHRSFWEAVLSAFDLIGVHTTNYDILVERGLRHRSMRPLHAGCYYGGVERPQLLRGIAKPFTVKDPQRVIEMSGRIPLYKLHGSLNWSVVQGHLELFQDMRPAFRHGGNAAIIPPITEKTLPHWMKPIWEEASNKLAGAELWLVCGYSPAYDTAICELLRKSSSPNLKTIIIVDPTSSLLRNRYQAIAPQAQIHTCRGLPEGIMDLMGLVS